MKLSHRESGEFLMASSSGEQCGGGGHKIEQVSEQMKYAWAPPTEGAAMTFPNVRLNECLQSVKRIDQLGGERETRDKERERQRERQTERERWRDRQ